MARRPSIPTFVRLLRHSPFRSPAWRWARAGDLVRSGRGFHPNDDDALTGLLVGYLQWVAKDRTGLWTKEFADIDAARQLHEAGAETRLEIEARLLARQTPEEIASRVGVSPRVVHMLEAVFFQVTDALNAVSWIVNFAVGLAPRRPGPPDPAAVVKSFAYFGGPVALDAVWPYLVGPHSLAAGGELPPPRDLLDCHVRCAVMAALLPEGAEEAPQLLRLSALLEARGSGPADGQHPLPSLAARITGAVGQLRVPWQGEAPLPTPPGDASELSGDATRPTQDSAVEALGRVVPGGANGTFVAQAGGDHGLGDARQGEVLLPIGPPGAKGQEAVPGRRGGRQVGGCRGGPAAGRAAGRTGAVGAGTIPHRGGAGSHAPVRGRGQAAAGGGSLDQRILAAQPPRMEEVA